jgi:hypothetical protein
MIDMSGYYDLVLGLIPLTFAAITAALLFFGFGVTTAVPGASLVSVGLIGHAMFVNGPVPTGEPAATDDAYPTAD